MNDFMTVFNNWNSRYPKVKTYKQNGFLRYKVDEAIQAYEDKPESGLTVSGDRDGRRVISFKLENGQTMQVVHNFSKLFFDITVTGKPVEPEVIEPEVVEPEVVDKYAWLRQAMDMSDEVVVEDTRIPEPVEVVATPVRQPQPQPNPAVVAADERPILNLGGFIADLLK